MHADLRSDEQKQRWEELNAIGYGHRTDAEERELQQLNRLAFYTGTALGDR